MVKADAVAPDKREAWVTKQVAQGVDVLICHPRLVQTGPVKVVFMAYRKTLQADALKLAARHHIAERTARDWGRSGSWSIVAECNSTTPVAIRCCSPVPKPQEHRSSAPALSAMPRIPR